jgi:hypothetical protein
VTRPLPTGAGDLTAEWLNEALAGQFPGRVTGVERANIGTGQVSDSVRMTLTWDPPGSGPDRLVAKVPSSSATSRATAQQTRTYEVEVGFFTDLAHRLPVRTPRCYLAARDPVTDAYALVFEDMAPAVQGDQLTGCTLDEAAAAIVEMALLHAPLWGAAELEAIPWLNRHTPDYSDGITTLITMVTPGFLERYSERLEPDVLGLTERVMGRFSRYAGQARSGPLTVAHGDFRVDNLLFGGDRVCVLDWQTAALGPGIADLSYFLGGSISVEDRRSAETDLVRHYQERLAAAGTAIDWDTLWADYRRFAFSGLTMAVVASMIVERTARGDDMFMAMANRAGRHALDLESETLI